MNDQAPRDGSAVLVCVLCGLIAVWRDHTLMYPATCSANAGAEHIRPGTPAAAQAEEIRKRWLRGEPAA